VTKASDASSPSSSPPSPSSDSDVTPVRFALPGVVGGYDESTMFSDCYASLLSSTYPDAPSLRLDPIMEQSFFELHAVDDVAIEANRKAKSSSSPASTPSTPSTPLSSETKNGMFTATMENKPLLERWTWEFACECFGHHKPTDPIDEATKELVNFNIMTSSLYIWYVNGTPVTFCGARGTGNYRYATTDPHPLLCFLDCRVLVTHSIYF
jgi:hypothetical protein